MARLLDRRVLAWASLTVGLLLLRSANSPFYLALSALAGSYGLQSILSSTAPFGMSSSTRALRRSTPALRGGLTKLAVRRLSRVLPAMVHTVWLLPVVILSFLIGTLISRWSPAALIVFPVLAVIFGSIYRSVFLQVLSVLATYVVLAIDRRPQVLALGIVLTILFSILAYAQKQWLFLGVTACTALMLCVLLPANVGPAYAVVGLIPLSLVVATRERLIDERERFRQLLVPANIIAAVAFLQSDPRWLAVPIILNVLLAVLAWESRRRISYAKYFVLFALAHLGLILFVMLQSGWLVLTLLLASVGIVALGITIGSLTTRLSGVASLVITLFLFTALIMPDKGGGWLGRDSLGLLIAISLPAFANWYSSTVSKRAERRLQYVFSEGSALFSAALAFTLIITDVDGPLKSLALLALGGVMIRLHTNTPAWKTAGLTLISCGVLLLCTVDVVGGHYVSNVLGATLLATLSGVALWLVARRNSRSTVY